MNNGYRLVFPIRKNGKGSISGVESAIESGGETIEPVVSPDSHPQKQEWYYFT